MESNFFEDFTNYVSEKVTEHLISTLQDKNFFEKKVPQTKQEYLTREEVASLCKIKSLSTLWSWRKTGLLVPTSKAGRKPLYLKSDVIDFLEGKKGGRDV